jgi:hypothetical protein
MAVLIDPIMIPASWPVSRPLLPFCGEGVEVGIEVLIEFAVLEVELG